MRGKVLLAALLCCLFIFGSVSVSRAAPAMLDPTFDGDGKAVTAFGKNAYFGGMARQADGKIVAVGDTNNGSNIDWQIARYNANGSLDSSFGDGGLITRDFGNNDGLADVAIQPDGKILVSGYARTAPGDAQWTVARYNSDGTPDLGFGLLGLATSFAANSSTANGVVVQPDGKIVAIGYSRGPGLVHDDIAAARYNPDGSADSSFGSGGTVTTGLNFGGTPNDRGNAVALQSDGKIVVFGDYDTGSHRDNVVLVRYNTDGSLDSSFDGDGKRFDNFSYHNGGRDVKIQADGKIVVTGATCNTICDTYVARYNTNGSRDGTFGSSGVTVTPFSGGSDGGNALAIQPDGKIVLAGAQQNGSSNDAAVRMYNSDGTLDTSFGVNGSFVLAFNTGEDYLNGVALQPDGKIVVGGASSNNGTSSVTDWVVARIIIDPGTVTGTVYVDTNGNGVQDNGEQGYEGATVHYFYGPGGGVNMSETSVVTDANGVYTITGVGPIPDNWLKIDMPTGYIGTTRGIYGFGSFTGEHVQDFGIGAPPVLPEVFSDEFVDDNGTTLADHDSNWTQIEQGMPIIQDNQLLFAQGTNPVGAIDFVMTDQCVSYDVLTPANVGNFLRVRYTNFGPGIDSIGYAGHLNTNSEMAYYDVAIGDQHNNYFAGNFSFPKEILTDTFHRLRLCAIGDQLVFDLDGMLLNKATTTQYSQGHTSIGAGPGNVIDNYKVEGTLIGPPFYPVSTNTRNTFGNNSITATVGSGDIPAGDTATVSVATGTFAGATGCSDSKGNTYSVAADRNSGQGRLFVCTSHLATALTAGDTVTATYPGFSGISVISLNAIAGFASNGTVLAASSANGNSAAPNSGNITVGGPAVLFGVVAHNSTPLFTPGADYTVVGQASGGSGSGKRTLSPEFKIVPAGGTYNANGTISNGGQFWQAAVVGYSGN